MRRKRWYNSNVSNKRKKRCFRRPTLSAFAYNQFELWKASPLYNGSDDIVLSSSKEKELPVEIPTVEENPRERLEKFINGSQERLRELWHGNKWREYRILEEQVRVAREALSHYPVGNPFRTSYKPQEGEEVDW